MHVQLYIQYSDGFTHSFDRQTLPIFTILKTKKGPRNLDYYITIGGDVKIAQYADPYALFFSSSH